MSFFNEYVENGMCCSVCGEAIDGKSTGFPRECDSCRGKVFEDRSKLERNKERSNYAIKKFKENKIKYELKNPKSGHFHVFRKRDNQLFQFWSGTGKIIGPIPEHIKGDRRGIATLIRILVEEDKNAKFKK